MIAAAQSGNAASDRLARRLEAGPVASLHKQVQVSNVVGNNNSINRLSAGGQNDIGIESVFVGGRPAFSAGLGPQLRGSHHNRGRNPAIRQKTLRDIEPPQRFGQSLEKQVASQLVVADLGNNDFDPGFQNPLQPKMNWPVLPGMDNLAQGAGVQKKMPTRRSGSSGRVYSLQ